MSESQQGSFLSIGKYLGNGTSAMLVWIFRLLLITAIVWFKSEFVTKEDYLRDQGKQIDQWTKLTSAMTHIDDVLAHLDKDNDDQEKRIRDIEKHMK